MFCCSSSNRKHNTKPGSLEGIKDNKEGSKLEGRTAAQQEAEAEEECKRKIRNEIMMTEEIDQEATIVVKCPTFSVAKTPFQIFLYQQQEPYNFQEIPLPPMLMQLQDESNIIIGDLQQIKEESQREECGECEDDEDDEMNNEEENKADEDRELTEEEAQNAAIFRWARENHHYCDDSNLEEVIRRVKMFKPLQIKEETRLSMASSGGGKVCRNKKLVQTLRSIGKQLIKQIGKQLLSGSLNLTTISFPIRAMIPKSALEKVLCSSCLFPLYINKACESSDPVERVKLLICATLGNFYINCSFLKPLNPILGETISGQYADGTVAFAEQISHHPPISYFLAIGAQKSYTFYGYYNYEASASLNSLTLKNKGKRYMKFANGQQIEYNYAGEEYSGSFWGSMKVESKGKIQFIDKQNDISAWVEFDSVRWKPSDYLTGEVRVKGKRVCKISGSYLGFLEFGDDRYWDANVILPYECKLDKPHTLMLSDASYRQDMRALKRNKVVEAQEEKELIEVQQRNDNRLRIKQQNI